MNVPYDNDKIPYLIIRKPGKTTRLITNVSIDIDYSFTIEGNIKEYLIYRLTDDEAADLEPFVGEEGSPEGGYFWRKVGNTKPHGNFNTEIDAINDLLIKVKLR